MKLILKFLLVLIVITITSISYLSLVGIKTTKFNNQIISKIKKINNNIIIDLKEIKIVLDPFRFHLQAKTLGPKLKNKNKSIEIESIKTIIPLRSLFNEKFILKDLEISTKTLEIKSLISFMRVIDPKPEFYILEKIIQKGFLIADIKFNFDNNGNLKNDYKIDGLIKDGKINIFDRYKVDKLDLIFNYNKDILKLNDISLLFNKLNFYSKALTVTKVNDNFLVKGNVENKNINLDNQSIQALVKPFFPNLDIQNLKFNSKSIFSLNLNKKFKLNNFSFKSELEIENISLSNNFELKKFFPKIKDFINFSEYKISIDYENKNLIIDGSGNVQLQEFKDEFSFTINKKNKNYDFKTSLKIKKNPFIIDSLTFKKDENNKAVIDLNGKQILDKKLKIDLIHYKEKENTFRVEDLVLNKKMQIVKFKKIESKYIDKEKKKNDFKITSKKNLYHLQSKLFNGKKLIDDLIDSDTKENTFEKDFKLDVKIDNLFLDDFNSINDFQGNLAFQKGKIINGNLTGIFLDNKKLNFTIKTVGNEKITTLFSDKAEPIVGKYKFIKGFNEGSLDFYSSKKDGESVSTIKIYDFKLKELPALTKILTLASLQGIADILSGEGIRFNEFEMNFRNKGNLMTIDEIYAIGPAISILMNGYVEKNTLISLRGTLVPATTLNKVIGSLPLIGDILVGKKTGEGVFGVSFKIKGPPKNLETTVNPIKTLTPRFITRTIEKIKKN
tara:strand:+ start:3475 stop:5658 length:2184 start_codon:yes stop_codon:yes gene_type:complete